jgi:very-short-patch-repair endonuclease
MLGRPSIIKNENYVEIVESYKKGESLSSLGRHYEVSKDTIKLVLIRSKVPIRNSKEVNIPWAYSKEMIENLYLIERKSIKQIATLLNSGYKAVRKALLREGIPIRGKNDYDRCSLSEDTKYKIRITKLGDKNPNYKGKSCTDTTREKIKKIMTGRKHTEKTIEKMSKTRKERGLSKGLSNPMSNPRNVLKWVQSNRITPNKQEIKLQQILDRILPGEYITNVKGQCIIINCKIPDFVCLPRKKLIEFYGDYWHRGENEQNRIDEFKQFGFSTLIIWEKELKNVKDVEDRILFFHRFS